MVGFFAYLTLTPLAKGVMMFFSPFEGKFLNFVSGVKAPAMSFVVIFFTVFNGYVYVTSFSLGLGWWYYGHPAAKCEGGGEDDCGFFQ